MDKYHVASVIFINPRGDFILQKRDDKPGILNPGMITAWGGAVEGTETPLQAAVRETHEETNLRPRAGDFIFLDEYPRDYEVNGKQVVNHVFVLRNVDETKLEIYEGQGFALIDPSTGKDNVLYTPLTRELIADYRRRNK